MRRVRLRSLAEKAPTPVPPKVAWGPDFGEGAGSDASTWRPGVNLDLASVDLAGTQYVGVAADLEHVALANGRTIGAALLMPSVALAGADDVAAAADLEAVALANEKSVGTQATLPALALANEKNIGAQATMPAVASASDKAVAAAATLPALAAANDKTVGVDLTGQANGAPIWQNVATAQLVGGSSLTLSKPSGAVTGNLLVAFLCAFDDVNLRDVDTPAGWTSIRTDVRDVGGVKMRVRSFHKFVEASDGASYTFTYTGAADVVCGELHLFIGAHSTTPINVHAGDNANAADPIAPAVTTTTTRCTVLAFLMHDHASTQTHTAPASHVERTDTLVTDSLDLETLRLVSATRTFANAASTGTATFDCTETLATDAVLQRIAIAPGPVPFS